MRLPRVRFTVRRLMVGVAIVGVLLAVGMSSLRLFRLTKEYRYQAGSHAFLEERWIEEVGELLPGGQKRATLLQRGYSTDYVDRKVVRARGLVAYESELKEKFQRAASRPWLPVAPDPPYPE